MTDRSEPTTAAGRALLDDLAYTRDNYLDPILAIEDEAGGAAIEEARMIASIEREAEARQPDSEALRSALERLLANAEHIFDKKPVRDWGETLAEARAALAALPPSDPPALDLADFANAVKGRCEISGDHYVYPRSVPMLLQAAKTHGIALSAQPEAQPAEDADGTTG